MSIQTDRQPYTPLTKEELRRVEKALKPSCKDLLVQVYSQLSVQQNNLDIQRAYAYRIHATLADRLRDIADSVETLEEHECEENHG